MRLNRAQHEELLMNLDPELLIQAAQRHLSGSSLNLHNSSSNNNNNIYNNSNDEYEYESSIDSHYSPSSARHLSPTQASQNSPARKISGGSIRRISRHDMPPQSHNHFQRLTSMPAMMPSNSAAVTPRIIRRREEQDVDLESLSSTMTSSTITGDGYSPSSSQFGFASHPQSSKKKHSKSQPETTLNMSTQVLPYMNSAMELAAEHFGNGTSLRKVSVVRKSNTEATGSDTDDPSPKGLFGRNKKKSKKEDPQTALVFSFSNNDFSKDYNDFIQQNVSFDSQESTDTFGNEPPLTPKISVTHADFGIGEDEPDQTQRGRQLKRYDSDATLTSQMNGTAPKISVSSIDDNSRGSIRTMERMESESDDQQVLHRISTADSNLQRKRTLDQLVQHQFQQHNNNQMLNAFDNLFSSDNRSIRSFRSHAGSERPTQSSMEASQHQENAKEKKAEGRQRFWDYWTMVSSIMYAICILVLGIVIYIFDLFVFGEGTHTELHLSEIFNITIACIGSAWIVWLIFDINKYTEMMKEYRLGGGDSDQPKFEFVEGDDGELLISIPLNASPSKKLPQYYCFSTGRHSGSFFLKSGATLFCLGHVIHIILIMIKQAIFLNEGNDCGSGAKLAFQIVQPLYVLLQLYMMFKFSNVIVNRSKGMARFAFMHCIATSMCFWIYTIVQETIDYIVKKYITEPVNCDDYDDAGFGDDTNKNQSLLTPRAGDERSCPPLCPKSEIIEYKFEFSIDCLIGHLCNCTDKEGQDDQGISELLFTYGDYLYPFSIEFSILIVGVWYIMWSNIGNVEQHKGSLEFLPSPRRSFDSGTGKPTNDALYINADCHSSVKGIFLGLCHLALCFVGTICYLVIQGSDCYTARIVNDTAECILLGTMIGATVWVYFKVAHLDINPHPINFLDDLLLFICIPSFFMLCLFSALPAMASETNFAGNLMTNLLLLVQVLIQTPMIVDGLRRCCDGQENQQRKPGRNLVTFLLVANLSLYIWDTLEAKSDGYGYEQKKFYGNYLWAIVKHMTLPLCIFYRFHSAVALADIWNSAYKPGDHH